MADKLFLNFSLMDKESKNCFRYEEVLKKGQERGVIGQLYVLKSELGNNPPKKLTVTIEAVK